MKTTLETACGRIKDGEKFGDVYPDFAPEASPEDVAALKYYFVHGYMPYRPDPEVTSCDPPPVSVNVSVRIGSVDGYADEACTTCGAFRLRRTGTCFVCDSCGTSGGCA